MGQHDISSTDCADSKLFIMTSSNGKDWSLPIMISDKKIHHFSTSIIEIENGTYMVTFQYSENYVDKIAVISFSDSDLENTNGHHFIFSDVLVMCFIFSIILIIICDVVIIREENKNWKK